MFHYLRQHTDSFRRLLVKIGNTDYQYAYAIINDEIYDLEIFEDYYRLTTLTEHIQSGDTVKVIFVDEENGINCYYESVLE